MSHGRPEIIQGSDRELKLTMRDVNGDGLDLSSVTEITACFLQPDQTYLQITLGAGKVAITDVNRGKITVSLNSEETPLIETGTKVSFKVLLDEGAHPGGTRRVVRFDQLIDVLDGDC